MSTLDTARRRWAVLDVAAPAALAVVAAATTPLPWWRPDRGAVLLGAGPVTELPPDTWTGVEMIGPWAAALVVPAGIAVVAAALAIPGPVRAERPTVRVELGPGGQAWAGWLRRPRDGRRLRQVSRPSPARRARSWGGARRVRSGCGSRSRPELAAVATALPRSGGDARRVARLRPASCAVRHGGFRVPAHTAAGRRGRGAGRRDLPRRSPRFRPASDRTGTRSDRSCRSPPSARFPCAAARRGSPRRTRCGRCSPTARPGWSAGPASSSRTRTAGRGCSRRTDRGAPAPIGVVGDRVVRWTASDTVAVTELRAGVTAGRRRPRRRGGGAARCRRLAVAAFGRRPGGYRPPHRRRRPRRTAAARGHLPSRRHDPGARPTRRSPDRAARARRGPADRLRGWAAGDADRHRRGDRHDPTGRVPLRRGRDRRPRSRRRGRVGRLVRARGRRRRPARPPRPERGEHGPDGPGRAARSGDGPDGARRRLAALRGARRAGRRRCGGCPPPTRRWTRPTPRR